MVGSRIVKSAGNCSKEFNSTLFHSFCKLNTSIPGADGLDEDDYVCDEYYVK